MVSGTVYELKGKEIYFGNPKQEFFALNTCNLLKFTK